MVLGPFENGPKFGPFGPYGPRLWYGLFEANIFKCPEAPSHDWGGVDFFICLFYVSDNFKEKIFEKKIFWKFSKFFGRQTLFWYNKKTRENSNVGYGFFPVRREKSWRPRKNEKSFKLRLNI